MVEVVLDPRGRLIRFVHRLSEAAPSAVAAEPARAKLLAEAGLDTACSCPPNRAACCPSRACHASSTSVKRSYRAAQDVTDGYIVAPYEM
jgi:hypothetical protein